MLIAGITGGIGSGKSLVCRVLQTFGVPVFYADDEVKKMYNEDAVLQRQLITRYGSAIYKDNLLQPKTLAQIVFNNSEALSELNAMVYPLLQQRFEQWLSRQHTKYVVQEAAMLCESGLYKNVSRIINVTAPEDIRMARVLQRNTGTTAQDVRLRMQRQCSDMERSKYAHFTIINDNKTALLPQILTIHKLLKINNITLPQGWSTVVAAKANQRLKE